MKKILLALIFIGLIGRAEAFTSTPTPTPTFTPTLTWTPHTPVPTSTPKATPTPSGLALASYQAQNNNALVNLYGPSILTAPGPTPTGTLTPVPTPASVSVGGYSGNISFNPAVVGNSSAVTINGVITSLSFSFNNAGLQPAIFAATSTPVYSFQVSDDGVNFSPVTTLNVVNATSAYVNQGTSSVPCSYFRIVSAGVLPTTTITPEIFTYRGK